MKNTNLILVSLSVLIAGLLLGKWFWGCSLKSEVSDVVDHTEKMIKIQRDSIRMYEKKLSYLTQNNKMLQIALESVNREHSNIRRSPVTPHVLDSLEVSVITRGIVHFGASPQLERRPKLASYGAQAFDNLETILKQKANQKAQIVAYMGIVEHQDTIIRSQEIAIRTMVSLSKEERRKGRNQGLLAGAGITALLFLLLK